MGEPTGGAAYTGKMAVKAKNPYLVVDLKMKTGLKRELTHPFPNPPHSFCSVPVLQGLAPLHFSKNKRGSNTSKFPPGHGDSAALCETTRRWFFHGKRRGRRPSSSLCGNPLVSPLKAKIPAGVFANRVAIPVPSPSFPLKGKYQK
jgi:hypothetical protein